MGAAPKQDEKIEPGTVVAGRYRVEQPLGEGGMGSVYLVQHVHTDERFAMKMLHRSIVSDQNNLERFRREARAPARIDSDHVARVTDADVAHELGDLPYLVMEYLRGDDLENLVLKRGALPPAEVVLYLRQAARALDKAHALGIVHRDLKPDNLFLTTREDGSPLIKLLDFGIAKLGGSSSDLAQHGSKTTTGQIFGTPLYMSPEQVKGESANVSPQTDVWALGIIAHRLLTGEDYWKAETLTHLIALIAYEPMKPPSEQGVPLGKDFDDWFLKCCARKPEERWKSAGVCIAELAQALGMPEAAPLSQVAPLSSLRAASPSRELPEGSALAKTSLSATSPAEPSKRSSALPIAISLLVVAGVGLGAWKLASSTADDLDRGLGRGQPSATTVVVVVPAPASAPLVAPTQTPTAPASAAPSVIETGRPEGPKPPPLVKTGPGPIAKATGQPTGGPAPPPTVAPVVTTAKPVSSDPFGGRQ